MPRDSTEKQPETQPETFDFEPAEPLPYHEVLRHELRVIDLKRGDEADQAPADSGADPELEQSKQALARDLKGLAFSGGGIRSATFNLGILQALSDMRLLSTFDYLSTVSGGGYIGSWLSALLARENHDVDNQDQAGRDAGIQRVQRRLQTRRQADQPVEDSAVSFLRQYSNYLTPKLGLLSADTWAMVATYLRNLLLNLLVLIPALAFVLSIPWLLFGAAGVLQHPDIIGQGTRLLIVSMLAGILATAKMGYSMASLVDALTSDERPQDVGERSPFLEPRWVKILMVAPLGFAAVLASLWLPLRLEVNDSMNRWALLVGAAYAIAWTLATAVALVSRWQVRQRVAMWAWLVATAAACGAVGGYLLFLLAQHLDAWGGTLYLVAFGPPLVLVWLTLLGTVQTGIMGPEMLDRQREWMSRLGAWLLIVAAGWAALFAAVVFGPVLLLAVYGHLRFVVTGAWLASIVGGLLASRGSGNGTGPVRGLVLAVVPYIFIAGMLLQLAVGLSWGLGTYACEGTLGKNPREIEGCWDSLYREAETWKTEHKDLEQLETRGEAGSIDDADKALLARRELTFPKLIDRLLDDHNALITNVAVAPEGEPLSLTSLLKVFLAAVVLLGTGLFLGWRVDINEFSMHSFYRNRLVRAYLGASVHPDDRRKKVQPFTGFYRGDDIPLAGVVNEPFEKDPKKRRQKAVKVDVAKPGPLHIVKTALNLVAGEELAWQERKSASFVLSPLYCGFKPPDEADGSEDDDSPGWHERLPFGLRIGHTYSTGYRRATQFASTPKRLSLGGAFAISGAAASPNMGFRSSPALSFLLTVFNVRLGWWLGNPRRKWAWMRSGPKIALLHLMHEVLGKTRGRTKYVYLSDGAHFENLGLYELVRRRCRFIVVTDAGADSKLAFDDIGNAIRKCRADLGAEIDLDLSALREDENGVSTRHCAVGTIRYLREGEEGRILYIKATVSGDESADILNYRAQHAAFPHESTGDQFFGESQFESYRQLGHHIATQVLRQPVELATDRPGAALVAKRAFRWGPHELGLMWRRIEEHWMPTAQAAGEAFIQHATAVDILLDRLRKTPTLRFLDAQVYPEWHRLLDGTHEGDVTQDTLWLPDSAEERRQGFYFCVEMIQLMENIYLDLNLDRFWNSRDNSGWMNYFRHWSWSGMFRVTWAITAATFGQRFQSFVRDRLGIDLGSIQLMPLPSVEGESDTHKAIAEVLERPEHKRFLNFYEREQVALFLAYAGTSPPIKEDSDGTVVVPHVTAVARMELVVGGAKGVDTSTTELIRFGIGYALLDDDRRLALFRIQDHLREMGLGTRALHGLLEEPIHGESMLSNVDASIEWAHRFENLRRALDLRIADQDPATALNDDEEARHRRFVEEFRGGGPRLIARLRAAKREVESLSSGKRRPWDDAE